MGDITAIAADYSVKVADAYDDLLREVKKLMRMHHFDKDAGTVDTVSSLAGKCGAACSAASKTAEADLILDGLVRCRAAGLDITPTLARHITAKLLGGRRKIDMHRLLVELGTPGRTAATKTHLTIESPQLAPTMRALGQDLITLHASMCASRAAHRARYQEKIQVFRAKLRKGEG